MITVENIINDAINGNPQNNETERHGITLFALVCSLNAKNILELGVRHGGSTIPLLLGAERTDGKVISVDIEHPSLKFYGGSIPEHLVNRWTFIRSDAIKFLSDNVETFDLIFVDDWHASEHLYNELVLISKFINVNTVICLHDLMHSFNHPHYNEDVYPPGDQWEGTGPYGGLMKFISENDNYEYSTIPVNHGLTILRKVR